MENTEAITKNNANFVNKRIQILMTTYNGERYLREQLDSFLGMERFEQVSVLIRDDGSTDGTIDILKQYSRKFGFTIIFGNNVGVNSGLEALLRASDSSCEYFAISDQDDVWLPDKLSIALEALDREPSTIPLLFTSLSHIVDRELNHLGSSVFPRKGVSYYNAMVQNVSAGHTQIFNFTLRNILLCHKFEQVHVIDWWIYLVASALGRVVFCPHFTVLHRQHGTNEVGYITNPFARMMRRLRYVNNGKGNAISKQLFSFYMHYKSGLPQEYRTETERYFNYMHSPISRIRYVLWCRAYRQQPIENIVFKFLYVVGKYRL